MPSGADHFDDLVRRAEERIGSTVDGEWKLDALLGVGGMAAVYAGTHRDGKRGAVKILHAEEALDPSVKARFLHEGFVANKVGHSGIATVLEDNEAPDGTVYLVMDLLEGESLETRCPPGKTLATGDVLAMVNQILDVLAAAHEKGIVHRDLKPSNLFLLPDGSLKVLDFGIARLHELTQAESQRAPQSTHSTLGTPGFMPPEQARGRWDEVDERSDLWSVGATMFVLLTGKSLHPDDIPLDDQLQAAMTQPCPHVGSVAPTVPQSVAKIIDRALAFKPEDRWPDAQSMQAAVRDAYLALTGRPLSFTGGRVAVRASLPDIPDLASIPTLSAFPVPREEVVRASSSRVAVVVESKASPAANGKWIGIAMLGAVACVVAFLAVVSSRSSSATAPMPSMRIEAQT
ncbi:MAG: serine/threonine protein kinase, partial [Polyangiaceae bacterium]